MNHHFVVAGLLIGLLVLRQRYLAVFHRHPALELSGLVLIVVAVIVDVSLF